MDIGWLRFAGNARNNCLTEQWILRTHVALRGCNNLQVNFRPNCRHFPRFFRGTNFKLKMLADGLRSKFNAYFNSYRSELSWVSLSRERFSKINDRNNISNKRETSALYTMNENEQVRSIPALKFACARYSPCKLLKLLIMHSRFVIMQQFGIRSQIFICRQSLSETKKLSSSAAKFRSECKRRTPRTHFLLMKCFDM